MPVLTLTTAGARQRLVTPSASSMPTDVACNRVTIQWISGTNVYLGMPRPKGTANAVSSTVYDIVLSSANPSFTIGPTSECNAVPLTDIWWDSDTSGATVSYAPVAV